jgi:hypothetical protein
MATCEVANDYDTSVGVLAGNGSDKIVFRPDDKVI